MQIKSTIEQILANIKVISEQNQLFIVQFKLDYNGTNNGINFESFDLTRGILSARNKAFLCLIRRIMSCKNIFSM